jgi:hypothetical protein
MTAIVTSSTPSIPLPTSDPISDIIMLFDTLRVNRHLSDLPSRRSLQYATARPASSIYPGV